MNPKSDLIFIPPEVRDQPLYALAFSSRLKTVLHDRGFQVLGDLHDRQLSKFLALRNCGETTLAELRAFLGKLSRGFLPLEEDPEESSASRWRRFQVAPAARELNPIELPISVRLDKALRRLGIERLGELDDVPVGELTKLNNCGVFTIRELLHLLERAASGEFSAPSKSFSPSAIGEVLRRLEEILEELPEWEQAVLRFRLGGETGKFETLQKVGARFQRTRERARQILEIRIDWMRRRGGPALAARLDGLAQICANRVCPLTPRLLGKWLGSDRAKYRFPLGFYVRLLAEMTPDLVAWPNEQQPVKSTPRNRMIQAMKEILQSHLNGLTFKEAFQKTRARPRFQNISPMKFLADLKVTPKLRVDFSNPSAPKVLLPPKPPVVRRRRAGSVREAVRQVLQSSAHPLTASQILALLRAKGEPAASWSIRHLELLIGSGRDMYLLGKRLFGLRQHFQLPARLWPKVREDVYQLLEEEQGPLPTFEMLDSGRFGWARRTNRYELVHVLRGDPRFRYLRSFLFGLRAWDAPRRKG